MRGMLLFLACGAALAQPVSSPPLEPLLEQRYCGPPKRDASGQILRSSTVLRRFRAAHPCPVTGTAIGTCAGWAIDHVIPLDCGGCDAVSNLQWLPAAIKSCAGAVCKDRFERKIYCDPMQVVPP